MMLVKITGFTPLSGCGDKVMLTLQEQGNVANSARRPPSNLQSRRSRALRIDVVINDAIWDGYEPRRPALEESALTT